MDNKKPTSTDTSKTIAEAFVKHQDFLKRFLSRFLSRPQDIEDVVQDTFLKAYTAEQDRAIHHPKAFLFQVARNTALKVLTKKSNQITRYIEDVDESEVPYEEISVEAQAMASQKLGIFCQSALEMPPQCRRVFLMAKVYGLSHKEISADLSISRSAVEKHVAKGLLICSNYLKDKEYFDERPMAATAATTVTTRDALSAGGVDTLTHIVNSANDSSNELNDSKANNTLSKNKHKSNKTNEQRDRS